MRISSVLGVVALSVVVSAATAYFVQSKHTMSVVGETAKSESTYERVMRTQTIRCGYFVWPPSIIKDPKTGALSGIFYDYMEALGKALNVKIEWAGEMQFASFIDDLKAHRYDAECSGGWPNATRGKFADYTDPIFFSPIDAFAHADDMRFDNALEKINDPNVHVVTIDGELTQFITNARFPAATQVTLPQGAAAELLLNVAGGKGDVAFSDRVSGNDYMEHNPGQIRRVLNAQPLKLAPNNITITQNEDNFRNMLNVATRELVYDGTIDRIIAKYETAPDTFLRLALPYKTQ